MRYTPTSGIQSIPSTSEPRVPRAGEHPDPWVDAVSLIHRPVADSCVGSSVFAPYTSWMASLISEPNTNRVVGGLVILRRPAGN